MINKLICTILMLTFLVGTFFMPVSAYTTSDEDTADLIYEITVSNIDGDIIDDCIISICEDGNITIQLPEPHILSAENQIKVTALLAEDETPAKDILVTVLDYQDNSAADFTNIHGKITVPLRDNGYTDESGFVRVNGYLVFIEDATAPIAGAYVVNIEDKAFTILLPDTRTFSGDNNITITILYVSDETPAEGMSVAVSDFNEQTFTDITDENGKVIMPPVDTDCNDKDNVPESTPAPPTSGGGSSGGGGSSRNNFRFGGGNVIVVTPQELTHTAYITGYPTGIFMPENSMTRAEAAALFARLLIALRGDGTSTQHSFSDVSASAWYSRYISYLRNHNVVTGYDNGTFRPNDNITRAEFVTMAVRFNKIYGNNTFAGVTDTVFSDVSSECWAFESIKTAVSKGWIHGYYDGTFRSENDITRAESVAVVNRLLGRMADASFIDANIPALTRFYDVPSSHWAYYEIIEATNIHTYIKNIQNNEIWIAIKK